MTKKEKNICQKVKFMAKIAPTFYFFCKWFNNFFLPLVLEDHVAFCESWLKLIPLMVQLIPCTNCATGAPVVHATAQLFHNHHQSQCWCLSIRCSVTITDDSSGRQVTGCLVCFTVDLTLISDEHIANIEFWIMIAAVVQSPVVHDSCSQVLTGGGSFCEFSNFSATGIFLLVILANWLSTQLE